MAAKFHFIYDIHFVMVAGDDSGEVSTTNSSSLNEAKNKVKIQIPAYMGCHFCPLNNNTLIHHLTHSHLKRTHSKPICRIVSQILIFSSLFNMRHNQRRLVLLLVG